RANPQLRNKKIAAALHEALEFVHSASAQEVFAMLVHVLRLGRVRAESEVVATAEMDSTYRRVVSFIDSFLQTTDGGSHLVAVVGAFVALLNEKSEVRVYPPNYSDKFAGTAGDVEIRFQQTLVSAYECKQRPLTLDDIQHGTRKAKAAGAREYCFVYSAGIA